MIIICLIFVLGGSGLWWAKENKNWIFADGIPILMYHAIGDPPKGTDKNMTGWYVSKEKFKEQMEYLKKNNYDLISFDELRQAKKYKKPIIVTFDDGYENNMIAYKILSELKDSKFKPKVTLFMIASLIDQPNYLNQNQLKQLSESEIFSIQSHTGSHIKLTDSTVNFQLEYEETNKKISKITGKNVYILSYPFGAFNDESLNQAKKYYKYAVTMGHDRFKLKDEKDELYKIKRLTISGHDSILKFILMVR
ncbi:polysaccharide deacetylase [Bacillus thuringiensis serovar brasilensis]|uniref:polysaccharide deacetylase family protein n=1 Tax=Bacillus cereus group TaxID=86661 RepID=UPI000A386DC0|nr:polysaccharide deacetylase family protein [Bacillus thuringiensis]MCU5031430.1 polysaccharide deacetylase family protein [Bacillus cereus]MRA74163.1 polysaccharide deacetylase family protein [Bacillus thuringiensis]MRA92727.1 polysaccharide deacetylase family protein [Bacillus thuringiensis]MRC55327.1 polysaccharide deacetylase family protein [Bacillus thuringiensis]OTX35214.1 polysaccharide deacetylase [Bacillus thuringiensis serovar brasilensis]